MRSFWAAWLAAAFLIGATSVDAARSAETSVTVASPDEQIQLVVDNADARLQLAATSHGTKMIEASQLGIIVDGVRLSEGATIDAVERREYDETYPWRGVHATAVNRCRAAVLSLTHAASGAKWSLELRVFNDGFAFRHVVPVADAAKARIPDEDTTFVLPGDATAWFHDLEGHYETVHQSHRVDEIEAGQWAAPPVTFRLPGDAGYAAITEAALTNYSGMALETDGKRGFRVALGHRHPASYPFRLRYEDDVEGMRDPAAIKGEIVSPWRVVILARDLNALVNSDLVHNVCPPPDETLFPHGMNTPWIKPGRAVWRYLDGGDNSLDEVKNFSRWAGELGFEYQVVEGFWSRWSDDEIAEAVEFSRKHGVGLWFWRHSKELRTPEAREEFFSLLKRHGVVGAKIDFFDHEHKEVVDHYGALLEAAARHQIMVNFHGANKPTGEARTWPNELTREAVKGMEARRLANRARHDATLPFTRYLAGPGDYTPVVFGERRGDTTAAHQIATAAVFDEPLLTYGAHPRTLLAHPAVAMIKSIPSTWDETIVLPDSAIGELAALARRSGDEWFLAVLNGGGEREISVPLDFLGAGEHESLQVRDVADDPTAVDVRQTTHDREDTLEIKLSAGGGFIGRFSKQAR
jgi:alpha-glucosidase